MEVSMEVTILPGVVVSAIELELRPMQPNPTSSGLFRFFLANLYQHALELYPPYGFVVTIILPFTANSKRGQCP